MGILGRDGAMRSLGTVGRDVQVIAGVKFCDERAVLLLEFPKIAVFAVFRFGRGLHEF